MKTVSVLLLGLLFIVIPPGLWAAEYSLDELWRLALQRSERIKVAEEDLYISMKEKDRALAVLLPTLTAFGSHTRYTDKEVLEGFTLQPEYSDSWGMRLDQSFSLGGRELLAYSIAKDRIRKTLHDLGSVRNDHIMEVTGAYFELLKAEKAVEIAEANLQRLRQHRDATRKRLEVGELTKTALLRAEAELKGAEADLLRARNNLRLKKALLRKIAGIEGDFEIREEPVVVDLAPLIGDCSLTPLDCLKKRAFTERPEMKAMAIQRRIAEKEVRYARGAYWPTLTIEGVYQEEENEPSTTFGLDERIYGVLRIDFPFFEGGLRKAEVAQAMARLRQVEYGLSELKKRIAVEVEEAYLGLLTISGTLDSLRAEERYALENFNAVSKQFEYGLADSLDVIDANTLLLTTERELSNAGYDHQLSFLRLRYAVGLLLKEGGQGD
jgi:outer membrane protein